MGSSIADFAGMDPGQAGRALIGWAEQLQRKAQTYRSLEDAMSRLVVTEVSAQGTVRVSVDGRGMPTELTITDRARGADPARLSAEMMSCLRRAQHTLAERVADLVTSSVPDGSDGAAGRIVASYRERFPRVAEDAAPPRPQRSRPSDDDDFGQSSFLR